MGTIGTTATDHQLAEHAIDEPAINSATRSEWNAVGLRPIAHWVMMPTGGGHSRLAMVWEVPDPLPPNRV